MRRVGIEPGLVTKTRELAVTHVAETICAIMIWWNTSSAACQLSSAPGPLPCRSSSNEMRRRDLRLSASGPVESPPAPRKVGRRSEIRRVSPDGYWHEDRSSPGGPCQEPGPNGILVLRLRRLSANTADLRQMEGGHASWCPRHPDPPSNRAR
jgi:hypothetical protein